MKNRDFIELLRSERDQTGGNFTIERIADELDSGRSHVNRVLLNKAESPRFGRSTRKRLVRYFKTNFKTYPAMLAVLGWNEKGELEPVGST